MSNDWDAVPTHHSLTGAMVAFAAAFALHAVDHFRRGRFRCARPVGETGAGLILGHAGLRARHEEAAPIQRRRETA